MDKSLIIYFVKHLDVWQDSEYASVICYSLFGKIQEANKLIQMQCKFTHFKI